jgi:hypothetical protein
MIHYQLRCGAEHSFDGWFKDSASFEKQAKRGLLECPVCGNASVDRALMAPSVPKKGRPMRNEIVPMPPAAPEPAPNPASIAVQVPALPAHMRAVLQRMRAEIEEKCDYVGDDFADEARRMHHGSADARGIYGETTAEDAESLAEEGIEVARIPWVPRADG